MFRYKAGEKAETGSAETECSAIGEVGQKEEDRGSICYEFGNIECVLNEIPIGLDPDSVIMKRVANMWKAKARIRQKKLDRIKA